MEELGVTLIDRNGKRTPGRVQRVTWNKAERTRRALKCLALCWLLSVVTVMIPLAHFVLVPGFFLGGILGAYFLSVQTSVVLGGEGSCPACGKAFEIVRGPDVWPLSDLCASCQMTVTIEK